MNIAIIGIGYVGLVTGACLSEKGHKVICVDLDEKKIEKLKHGIITIYEDGLQELINRNYSNGNIEFTTDYDAALKDCRVVFIGVGTPEREDGSANLEYIYDACRKIAEKVNDDTLIVIKSTVPVGTNDKLEEYLKKTLKNNVNIEFASNPEFLAQGTAVRDTMNGERIVIGVKSHKAEKILKEIYKDYNQPIVVTDRKSAEMIKYACNDFLALKISFINEIANLCEVVGADIDQVVKGMEYDTRIGNKFLKAGIGYGGSCFPKDTKALHWLANDHGYELKTIKATIEVNQNQRFKLFRKAKKRFGTLYEKKIAVLGLTFKPETDDLRESPAIPNIGRMLDEGALIYVYDPKGIDKCHERFKDKIKYKNTVEECIEDCDAAFIFTDWSEIKNIQLNKFKKLMKTPIIFDGRNCFDLQEVKKAELEYYSIGRKPVLRQ